MAGTVMNLSARRTGAAIRTARDLAGFARAQDLADRISEISGQPYTANRVTKLEKGYRLPNAWELAAISEATGWSVDDLMHPPFPTIDGPGSHPDKKPRYSPGPRGVIPAMAAA